MKKLLLAVPAAFLSLAVINTASASSVPQPEITQAWEISDATNTNTPHGLWTNGLVLGDTSTYSGRQLKRYSFDPGSYLIEYNDGSAHIQATATNASDFTASIDIWFDNWTDTYSTVKTGGGSDTSDWNFYTTVRQGSSITLNSETYYLDMVNNGTGPVLQIGTGANDKTAAFGASTWLDVYSDEQRTDRLFGTKHWDLNMDLTTVDPDLIGSPVPVPAAAWLFISGLIGLISVNRRAL